MDKNASRWPPRAAAGAWWKLLVIAAGLVLPAAGCGSGGSSASPSPGT